MNSASILMNLTPAAPAVPAAAGEEQASAGIAGFDQALASVQAESEVPVVAPDAAAVAADATLAGDDDTQADLEPVLDASGAGAAAILAQMLAGSSPPARTEAPTVADAGVQATLQQSVRVVVKGADTGAEGGARSTESGEEGGRTGLEESRKVPDLVAAVREAAVQDATQPAAAAMLENSTELTVPGAQSSQSAPQGANTGLAAVQAAASALRDAAPAAAAASSAPVHAALREPVGTARWADELGNRLVMMSVRGQQQGSLTLTPEHLGPVEVQISMNRDTANIWFGAQHADTRTALAEAMPRLRELLATSGLSLGQSGVSEQAPRENFASPASLAGSRPPGIDADPIVERAAPAWRVWRPGLIDTYA